MHLPKPGGRYSSLSSSRADDEDSACVTIVFATDFECLGGLIVGFFVVKCLAELDFGCDTPLALVSRAEKLATFSIKDLLM